MKSLIAFNIPIYGITIGTHLYEFRIEKSFFEHFPSELIDEGTFDVRTNLDKRANMLVVDMEIEGTQRTTCDRCLEMIDLPVSGKQQIIFKYADEADEEGEMVYLSKGTQELNLAKYIHESICFALPLIKTYDCEAIEEPPCNEEMLKYLDHSDPIDDDANEKNPLWDALNNLNQGLEP